MWTKLALKINPVFLILTVTPLTVLYNVYYPFSKNFFLWDTGSRNMVFFMKQKQLEIDNFYIPVDQGLHV